MVIRCDDFRLALTKGQLEERNPFTYLDYSYYERQMNMDDAKQYWFQLLNGYDRDKQLQLPFDHHLETSQRSGQGNRVHMKFDSNLVVQMIRYANDMNISMFQLCLSCYYLYLFKLTHDEDICIGSVNSNRYRHEIQSVIGMFVNLLPYRIKVDMKRISFHHLIKYVQQLSSEILSNGHLPYQQLIQLHKKDTNESSSLLPYIQTMLQYNEQKSSTNELDIDFDDHQIHLSQYTLLLTMTTKFDLTLNINYMFESKNQLECSFDYSSDVFKHETIQVMCQRFQQMLCQLFQSSFNKEEQPLYELSIILPYEEAILHDLNETSTNSEYSHQCIHHQFIRRSQEYSTKVALILDEQCLTYAELFYYVTLVSTDLI